MAAHWNTITFVYVLSASFVHTTDVAVVLTDYCFFVCAYLRRLFLVSDASVCPPCQWLNLCTLGKCPPVRLS